MSESAWGQVVAPWGCDFEPTAVAPKPAGGWGEGLAWWPEVMMGWGNRLCAVRELECAAGGEGAGACCVVLRGPSRRRLRSQNDEGRQPRIKTNLAGHKQTLQSPARQTWGTHDRTA